MHPIKLGATAFGLLATTLLCVAAVPFFWWLADQRLIPWRDDARWLALRRVTDREFPFIDPGAFIEMSRESCFGFCPVYRVKLFASGRVEYAGKLYVCAVGESAARVDPRAAAKLIAHLESAGLFELDWNAEDTWTDAPHCPAASDDRRSNARCSKLPTGAVKAKHAIYMINGLRGPDARSGESTWMRSTAALAQRQSSVPSFS
jgi:hypothetical protein